ncbi:MAG: tetratricopeptide repeat protein [Deltaproteobacteria bacterium]|uniref:Tetratricopeptide repeat protein n=1 Tax=Candidatus Zymogenus saltonus TaxID=2844893 RepID=A0A9D8KCQ7_9DELT|nr:tetratricopeptide repeat protein [Candidatus Zymogenus saltonus]
MKRKNLLPVILSLVLAVSLLTAAYGQDLKTRVNEIERAHLDGKLDGVINKYKGQVKENPNDPVLHYLLGIAYLYSEMDVKEATFDKAYKELARAKELDPNMKYVNYSLGTVYWYRGEHEKALDAYREEIRLDPEDGWNYYNLGLAYEGLKKWDKAWSQYIIAIEKDPTIHYAHNNLGGIALNWKGDFFRALDEFKAAMELKPDEKLYRKNYNKAVKKLKGLKDSVEKGELTLPTDEKKKLNSLDLKEVEVE